MIAGFLIAVAAALVVARLSKKARNFMIKSLGGGGVSEPTGKE